MEKKLKYLLGFFVALVGLFVNQTFAFCPAQSRYTPVYRFDLVTIPFASSSNYQQHSSKLLSTYGISATAGQSFIYSTLFQDGNTQGLTVDKDSTFNSSYLGYTQKIGSNPDICYVTNYNNYYANNYATFGFYHGLGSDFGKFSFGSYFDNRTNTGYVGPVFAFGNQYFTPDSAFRSYVGGNIPSIYYRLFYQQGSNLSDPVESLNLFDIENNIPFFARQYFTDYGFTYMYSGSATAQSDAKTFRDLGGDYKKTFNIGGYGMGYSYVINTLGQTFVRWEDFSFVSVGSRCLQSLMQLGMSDPNSGTASGCQQVGFLVLKGNSYVSKNNNASVLVLSKNPYNKSQILYEQFDCAEDSISRIFDTNYCNSLSHGYIEIDGTGAVLPFLNNNYYFINSGNKILDTLLKNNQFGYIEISNNQYCLKSDGGTACFTLTHTPSQASIKELYLNGSINGIPSITNASDITQTMINNCKGPYYNTPDGLPPAYCNSLGENFTGNFYTSIGVNDSGNIVVSIIQTNPDDTFNLNESEFVIDENGNYVAICSGDCNGSYIYYGSLGGTTAYSTGYFDQVLNNTGFYFQCPYSYTQKLVVGKKLINFLGGYDIFLPINCAIASYEHGKSVLFFSSSGLSFLDQPLLHYTGGNRDTIYKWLDFMLILGLLFLFAKINKGFNH